MVKYSCIPIYSSFVCSIVFRNSTGSFRNILKLSKFCCCRWMKFLLEVKFSFDHFDMKNEIYMSKGKSHHTIIKSALICISCRKEGKNISPQNTQLIIDNVWKIFEINCHQPYERQFKWSTWWSCAYRLNSIFEGDRLQKHPHNNLTLLQWHFQSVIEIDFFSDYCIQSRSIDINNLFWFSPSLHNQKHCVLIIFRYEMTIHVITLELRPIRARHE